MIGSDSMTEIYLEGLEFYAHHGWYSEEQSLGNRFQVDLKIGADVDKAGASDQIQLTVDYVAVYKLVSEVMNVKFKLLETLGQRIISEIRTHFPQVNRVEVTISKFNPPISGLCKRVAVTSKWSS